MKKALKLARKGEGTTSPNPMVGAVVVKNNEIIGRGHHKYYGAPHAEVYALEEAGKEADGATIYVTLEPCSHYGKTPPCSLKLINSGIKRAVIAMEDPNPLVAGRGILQLQEAGIAVKVGVLKKEAEKLNEVFIKYITTDFPFVYLKTAQTIDGYLASKTGDSRWITNKKARLRGHQLRNKVDATLVGIGTVRKDDPQLTTRLPDTEENNGISTGNQEQDKINGTGNKIGNNNIDGSKGQDSIRLVLDTHLKIPVESRIVNHSSDKPTIIVTGKDVSEKKAKILTSKRKVEILSLPLDDKKRIPLRKLLEILHTRKISSLLVEGGGKINYSFLQEGLVDKYYAFIAPRILGGNDGISSFSGKGPDSIMDVKELKNIKYEVLDKNILLSGYL